MGLDTRGSADRSTFSPDGKLFATAGEDFDPIELFDTVTGSLHCVLEGHGAGVSIIEFSPESTVLASGSWDRTVKLWDASIVSDYDIPSTSETTDIMVSPRGNLVTSCQADSIKLWSTQTGHLELEGHAVVFNQNEDLVACALLNHTISLQNLETGAPPLILDGHARLVSKLVFSPENKLLASVSPDQTVNLWGVETGALCFEFSYAHAILEVVFSPDGKLLATVLTGDTVVLESMTTGTRYRRLHAPKGLRDVMFSPDGMLLAPISDYGMYWVSRMWLPQQPTKSSLTMM